MTFGFTQYQNPYSWAHLAEKKAVKFLQNPSLHIKACRSVVRCVKEDLIMTSAFSFQLYVHEEGYGRIIQSKVKGLVRPVLFCYYKNDPPDYTGSLDNVTLQIIDLIAQQRHKMPQRNQNAIVSFYNRLNDS